MMSIEIIDFAYAIFMALIIGALIGIKLEQINKNQE